MPMQENGEIVPLAPELGALSTLIDEKPENFASGSREIQTAALNAAKYVFDLSVQTESVSRPPIVELLSSLTLSAAPQTRSRTQANATKRSPSPPLKIPFPQTPITSLFIEGMDDEQIWAQLDLRTKSICEMLDLALEGEVEEGEDEEASDSDSDVERDEKLKKALEAIEKGEEVDLEGLGIDSFMDDSEEDSDAEDDSEEEDEDEGSSMGEGNEDFEEGVMGLRNESSDDDDDDNYEGGAPSSLLDVIQRPAASRRKSKAKSQLDDDFFDLASFNAETEQAEAKSTSRGHLGEDADSDDDDMSVDLFAAVDEDAQNFDEDDLENNAGEAFYGDFFEPPKRVAPTSKSRPSEKKPSKPGKVRFHEEVRVKKIKAKGKNLPLSFMDEEEDEDDGTFPHTEDMQFDKEEFSGHTSDEESDMESEEGQAPDHETMERLKDDLFAEDDEGPSEDLTTHEKRMSALREQIAELEAENVAPKEWMLKGEAGSRTRPQNSLLEEDLEFERVMKPAPVITEETVKTLEERIKARILDNQFDDVVRLRPLEDKPFLPSRFFELQDAKSSQSLAQIYENEYISSQTGGAVDDRDGKLKKEHEEIEQLWEKICGKLDALCNAHFVPKQPKATISTVSNVSTATLESALPTAKSVSTMLAPEEVFAPSSSEPRSRSELTPAEKRALRTKERKAKKKQRDTLEKSVDKFAKAKSIGGVKKQKQAALESVVKHGKGVTVVGKRGKDILDKKERKSRT